MKYRIVNVVATCSLGTNLDLETLEHVLSELGTAIYDPDTFPGLILKLRREKGGEGSPSVLIFRTGNMVIAGARSEDEVLSIVKRILRVIRHYVDLENRRVRIQIQNMVATASFDGYIDLERMARELPNAMYEPEQFPGLVLRLESGPVALVFSTGRVVIVGARTEEDVVAACRELSELLRRYIVDA